MSALRCKQSTSCINCGHCEFQTYTLSGTDNNESFRLRRCKKCKTEVDLFSADDNCIALDSTGEGDCMLMDSSNNNEPVFSQINFDGNFKELNDTNKHHLREVLFQQSCNKCGNEDESQFNYFTVDNTDELLQACDRCGELRGFDDTMSYYEIMSAFEVGTYSLEPCHSCGNSDPYKVIFEQITVKGNEVIVKKCLVCGEFSFDQSLEDKEEERGMEEGRLQEESSDSSPCGKEKGSVDFHCEYNSAGSLKEKRCQNSGWHTANFDRNECSESPREQCLLSASKEAVMHEFRCRVSDLLQLAPGDHVTWHQPLAYWHHAIVTKVNASAGTIEVIHYNGPALSSKAEIMRERLTVDCKAVAFYLIHYPISRSLPVEIVMDNAKSRLGESCYSLTDNNCEHFARWCKTGERRSEQVEDFKTTLKKELGKVACHIVKGCGNHLMKGTAKITVSSAVGSLALSGCSAESLELAALPLQAAGKEMVKKGTLEGVGAFVRIGGTCIVVCLEVAKTVHQVARAAKLRRDGAISDNEFKRVVVKSVISSTGSLAGMAIGSLVLPVVGGVVGATVGSVIGQGAGLLLGRWAGEKTTNSRS